MQSNSSSIPCPQLLPALAFLPCSSLHPLPAGWVAAGGHGCPHLQVVQPGRLLLLGGVGGGGGKLVPSWLSLSRIPMSFPRVSPGFPKAAWALRPLSVRVPLGRSWPAGPQAVDGVNGGRQTRHEFVRLGWGTGVFLGNQAGNTTHSAKPGRACKC